MKKAKQETSIPVICDIGKATFKDRRGLVGHKAGKHRVKIGLNTTLDEFRKELQSVRGEVRQELQSVKMGLDRLVDTLNKRYIQGQECLNLADAVLTLVESGQCNGGKRLSQLRSEVERLKRFKGE